MLRTFRELPFVGRRFSLLLGSRYAFSMFMPMTSAACLRPAGPFKRYDDTFFVQVRIRLALFFLAIVTSL